MHHQRTNVTTFRAFLALGALLVAVSAAAPSPAGAQEDARWLPWLGCWESVGEYDAEGMLCVRPTADGVEMLSVVDGEVTGTDLLTGDGRAQRLEREGCTGWQTARFSSDDRRLFTTSEHTCEGEFSREATGLMAMTSPSTWIDVQVVDAGGRKMAWVRRYRLAAQSRVEESGLDAITAGRGMALRTARYEASAAVDVDDVVEATRSVHQEAVKAWVAEIGEPFDLNARRLVDLSDAGVDPGIIDVMIAVSYPERFAVDRETEVDDRHADRYGMYGRRGMYGRYGYRGGYFYDPFYSPYRYGYGGSYYGYRPTVVVVTPIEDDGAGAGRGRLVKGRGYTRGTRSSGDGGSGGGAVRSGGRSGGSSVGSSGTSSGSSTGRKAKRRGGGGGEGGGDGGSGGGGSLF